MVGRRVCGRLGTGAILKAEYYFSQTIICDVCGKNLQSDSWSITVEDVFENRIRIRRCFDCQFVCDSVGEDTYCDLNGCIVHFDEKTNCKTITCYNCLFDTEGFAECDVCLKNLPINSSNYRHVNHNKVTVCKKCLSGNITQPKEPFLQSGYEGNREEPILIAAHRYLQWRNRFINS